MRPVGCPGKRGERGFTLVEVLAALGIVTMLLLAAMSVFTSGYIGVRQGGTRNQAISEAQRALEATRSWMIDQWKQNTLPRVNNSATNVQISWLNGYGFQPSPGMQTIITATYNAAAKGWDIQVSTQWNDRGPRKFELTSFFGDYDHAKRPASP